VGFGTDIRHAKGIRWSAKAGLRLKQEEGTEERSLVQLEKRLRDCQTEGEGLM